MALTGVLTSRDLELVVMLARGHTTDRVAREFQLSRHTVGERISALLGRMKCKNRAELVAYCYAHGLLPTGVWPPRGLGGFGNGAHRNGVRSESVTTHASEALVDRQPSEGWNGSAAQQRR